MKNKSSILIFPVLAFVLAITTAFAFSSADLGAQTIFIGYKRVGGLCLATNVQCTSVDTGVICKDVSGNTLYRLNITGQCPNQLWVIP